MLKVIVDTSAILYGFEYRKDVFDAIENRFGRYEAIISRGVLRELDKMSTNKGKKGAAARAALNALKAKNIKVDSTITYVDRWISKSAQADGAAVVTNDSGLAAKLLSEGVRVFKMSKSGKIADA
ncbi:MAG: DUF188 domain-containing protein [Candidatus Micrarchaeaceae archaeon]